MGLTEGIFFEAVISAECNKIFSVVWRCKGKHKILQIGYTCTCNNIILEALGLGEWVYVCGCGVGVGVGVWGNGLCGRGGRGMREYHGMYIVL